MSKYIYRTIFASIFINMAIFSMSCFQAVENQGNGQSINSTEEVYEAGEQFDVENTTYILENAERVNSIDNIKPLDGNDFVITYIQVEGNITNQAIKFDPTSIKISDSRGTQFDAFEPSDALTIMAKKTKRIPLSECTLNVTDKTKTIEIFEVPETANKLKLVFVGWDDKELVRKAEVDLGID